MFSIDVTVSTVVCLFGDSVVVVVVFAGLCPDWETWDEMKPVDNATEAMKLADDWLGVPQVRFPLTQLHIFTFIQHFTY